MMTWNIRHGRGYDDRVDLDRIAAVIECERPDIVGLQEVDVGNARSGETDQVAALANRLGMYGIFGHNVSWEAAEHGPAAAYGTAMLLHQSPQTWTNEQFPIVPGWEPRGVLRARLMVPGVAAIDVYNTHLQVGDRGREAEGQRQRAEQVNRLVTSLGQSIVPVILMGDFNALPDAPELAPLRDPAHGFRDAWIVGGDCSPGDTFPAHPDLPPAIRIDYIWASAQWDVTDCRIVASPGARAASDHLPVVADLELRPDARNRANQQR